MKEYKDWFIEAAPRLDRDSIKQISRLIGWLEKAEEGNQNATYESSLYAAMLGDICEARFGINGNGAPSDMGYAHAGWVCGPTNRQEGVTLVEYFYHLKKITSDKEKEIKEWNDFINTLTQQARQGKEE